MLAEAGLIYVYAAYGMYPCLNIVTGPVGIPSAVLVRGVWVAGDDRPTLGPGRTTRRLGVGMDDHGRSIGDGRFAVTASRVAIPTYETPRIGITRATEVLWRFVADVSSIEIP
jgi:DNA-3-methyladenine glycosylase